MIAYLVSLLHLRNRLDFLGLVIFCCEAYYVFVSRINNQGRIKRFML